MNQSNLTTNVNCSGESDTHEKEQPIPTAMRFRKAFLMAALMLVIGWAIGAV